MEISLNWLKDYVDFEIEPQKIEELGHRFAVLGFEPESIEHINRDFEKVVVGKVLEKNPHPDADKLAICKVRISDEEIVEIVCGAPNVDAGQTVPVALVGAKFGDFKIKKSKIRGVVSFGMICAEDELGIGASHEGIMVLDDKYEAGTPFKELFGYEDFVYDIELTQNRPDAFGYFGFARECAFLMNKEYHFPKADIVDKENSEIKSYIDVEIKDEVACPRYASRLIKSVKVKESPKWLKEKLNAIGLRPINNVVDITNFVLMETGHPLHAFDYANIAGNKIIVRKATNDEKFTTLDGSKYDLNDEILLICDAEKPVALAGVMGGENSGVTDTTTDVLLECAYFNLADIRHTVKHLNLFTDASKRFEKSVDPNDVEFVINRAALLIKELGEGDIVHGMLDIYPNKIKPIDITVRFDRVEKILGFLIPKENIIENLNKIELKVTTLNEESISVNIPTFRPDIKREIDIIEEIVRLYGYDKIPEITSSFVNLEISDDKDEADIDKIRKDFVTLGFNEISAKSMVDGKYCQVFNGQPVKIMHPLNEEMNHLRNSLLISLLDIASVNIRRGYDKISIFEAGKRFELLENNDIKEQNSLSAILSGTKDRLSWNTNEQNYDFYDIKGIVEGFLNINNCCKYKLLQTELPNYFDQKEALSLFIDDKYIGSFGKITKKVCNLFEINQAVYAFEFDLDKLEIIEKSSKSKIKETSKYPKVIKDLSLLMDDNKKSEEIVDTIKRYGGSNLQMVEVIDFYKGDQIESDKKSYSYRMTFRSQNSTMTEKQIEKMFNKVIKGVTDEHEITLR